MGKCATSLTIREMQIKITRRYHLTAIKVGIIKHKVGYNVEKGTFVHWW